MIDIQDHYLMIRKLSLINLLAKFFNCIFQFEIWTIKLKILLSIFS